MGPMVATTASRSASGGARLPDDLVARIEQRLDPVRARSFRLRWQRHSPDLLAGLREAYGVGAKPLDRKSVV